MTLLKTNDCQPRTTNGFITSQPQYHNSQFPSTINTAEARS